MNPLPITPGWEVHEAMPRSGSFVIRGGVERSYARGRGRDQLFMVCGAQPDNGGPKATRANAYLAGAAPQLYETLRRLVDRDFTYMDGTIMGGQLSAADIQAARELLARVESEAS